MAESNLAIETLAALKIEATTHEHPLAYTVEEQAVFVGHLPGSLTKNLFLRDKKHGLFLVTTIATRDVNMKTLGTLLKLSGSNLRLGDEDLLKEKLNVIRGAVSPLALVNATPGDLTFCIDKALLDAEIINVHPLRNDRTTSITPTDLLKFLEHINCKPTILDFGGETSVSSIAKVTSPNSSQSVGDLVSKVKTKKFAVLDLSVSSTSANSVSGNKSGKPENKTENKTAKPQKAKQAASSDPKKGETKLGLTAKKEEDFANWYTQAITLSEMIDYSDISGCYILRPWSYFMWESIQKWFDEQIKELGVSNTYFPLFVSQRALETEKDHVEGFAPEVAWVTKSGDSELAEPIAIRPTSETIMYPFFAKWIRSHRDLPLEINQWCNVVRWEFKDATPFLRSREFLWQEGHTAHVSYEEAQERVLSILDLYRQVYEDLLAVPVIKGMKTEKEKFAGGYHTTTVEAYINGSGRAIQGATSHNLGQNFGKMFHIYYEDDTDKAGGSSERKIPWQTSWGLTTRTLGVCVMVHGDNKGLVLPPRVAPIQVIIISITNKDMDFSAMVAYCNEIKTTLKKQGVRADTDLRQEKTPGWRYNHWEQKGVPIRIEVGPKDMASSQCRFVRRDNGDKFDVSFAEVGSRTEQVLKDIHIDMFNKAKEGRDAKLVTVTTWDEFVPALEKGCLVLTPFCDIGEWEEKVKDMSRNEALRLSGAGEEAATCSTSVAAKTLCKPFDHPPLSEGTPCFVSGLPATAWVLWGRSY